ncbi:MAG: ferrochelatase, partial [Ilumatobacteraceae bacterium]
MTRPRTAVLLMAYGTPRSPEEILPYYTDIRRGRAPSEVQLADLTRRYAAIGGISPLAERTNAQRAALQCALDAIAPDEFSVVLGLKHATPTIESAVAEIADSGIR